MSTLEDEVQVIPLGAGQEAGRSCILVKFRGKTVMLDCGIHPGHKGTNSLPFLDTIKGDIDLVLISHFHLDHCGAIPFLTQKFGYTGPIYMTHPTRAFYQLILNDYQRVSHIDTAAPFDINDIRASMSCISTVPYHQHNEHNGIKFWCYNAGHVLGAACWIIEIDGVRIVYTGDFTLQPDRHLMGAEIDEIKKPENKPDVLIIESTYGTQNHKQAKEREKEFTRAISDTLTGGGKVLLPVFALGRAQELLLILEDHWARHPDLSKFPIYYISPLAQKCLQIFRTYVNTMNDAVQTRANMGANPWNFAHITEVDSQASIADGPCVVMCSPGMLQSGASRHLFDKWAGDPLNLVMITGYAVEGTLAKTIQREVEQVPIAKTGELQDLKAKVDVMSFSAHSDCAGTTEFIQKARPRHIVFVHGEEHQMLALRRKIDGTLRSDGRTNYRIHTPRNTDAARCDVDKPVHAEMLGDLTTRVKGRDGPIDAVCVTKANFDKLLVAPNDPTTLSNQTPLQLAGIEANVEVRLSSHTAEAVSGHLKAAFGPAVKAEAGKPVLMIGGVTVELTPTEGTEGCLARVVYSTATPTDDVMGGLVCTELQGLVDGLDPAKVDPETLAPGLERHRANLDEEGRAELAAVGRDLLGVK